MDTVTCTKRGTPKKHFVVSVTVNGIDPGLIASVNSAIADNFVNYHPIPVRNGMFIVI